MTKNSKFRLRKGDEVRIIAGGSKGVAGTIVSINTDKQTVTMNGVEMITRHYKADNRNPRGHSKKIARNIPISNVAITHPDDKVKTSKIAYSLDSKGNKIRKYKVNNKEIKG